MSWAYLYVFLQSNLLEVPFYYWILRRKNESLFDFVLIVTAINSLTHPIVYFGIMNLKLTYLQNILIAEFFAIVAETLFFAFAMKRGLAKSFLASAIANLVSWQAAPVITYVLFK